MNFTPSMNSVSTTPMNRSLQPLSVDDLRSPSPQKSFNRAAGVRPAAPGQEKRFVPSHLAHLAASQRRYAPDVSSPLVDVYDSPSSIRTSNSPPSKFGGPSFGTPKPFLRPNRLGAGAAVEDAPPTQSIYDFPTSRQSHALRLDSAPVSTLPVQSKSTLLTNTTVSAPPPNQQSQNQSTSVIVFGFPPALTTHVLNEFSRFGPITNHTAMAKNGEGASYNSQINAQGNWVQLTYANLEAAARAVQANGTIIADSYMVGCVYAPTHKPGVPSGARNNVALDIEMMDAEANAAFPSKPVVSEAPEVGRKIVVKDTDKIFKTNKTNTNRNWLWGNAASGAEFEKSRDSTLTPVAGTDVQGSSGSAAAAAAASTAGEKSFVGKVTDIVLHTLFGF
ncbi:nucleoporin Nup40 [Schizosaccharomyces japonicus yFS275]|uniref:Nucleoporin Nup40 n=1 Tax=Schizosaccharomyces japonicus (strain yFS275 / FY16936) TaxID=402676 RepID=B6K4N1_SCHJY|nr:nucleoporin Nup40 [Schizosaccharomyces japonicus yFS275]EEB08438.2 nucleoporin Nup40 [Schizosaccharomyces japonicus yFS275]